MDRMRITGIEPTSVTLSQTEYSGRLTRVLAQ